MGPAGGVDVRAAARREAAVDDFDVGALYRLHYGRLRSHCARLLGDQAEAADVAQEAIVRAWIHRDRLHDRGPEQLRPWLWTVATRLCVDASRRRRPVGEPGHADRADPGADPSVTVERHDDRVLVRQAFGALSERDRVALLLREVHELDYEEVASRLEMSVGAARVLLFRARERLRAAVEDVRAGAWAIVLGLTRRRVREAAQGGSALGDVVVRTACAVAAVALVTVPAWRLSRPPASGGVGAPGSKAGAVTSTEPDVGAVSGGTDAVGAGGGPSGGDPGATGPVGGAGAGPHVSVGPDGASVGTSVPGPGSGPPVPVEAWANLVDDGQPSVVMDVAGAGLDLTCATVPRPCKGLSIGEGGS